MIDLSQYVLTLHLSKRWVGFGASNNFNVKQKGGKMKAQQFFFFMDRTKDK